MMSVTELHVRLSEGTIVTFNWDGSEFKAFKDIEEGAYRLTYGSNNSEYCRTSKAIFLAEIVNMMMRG